MKQRQRPREESRYSQAKVESDFVSAELFYTYRTLTQRYLGWCDDSRLLGNTESEVLHPPVNVSATNSCLDDSLTYMPTMIPRRAVLRQAMAAVSRFLPAVQFLAIGCRR
jgi:hypothetical protein